MNRCLPVTYLHCNPVKLSARSYQNRTYCSNAHLSSPGEPWSRGHGLAGEPREGRAAAPLAAPAAAALHALAGLGAQGPAARAALPQLERDGEGLRRPVADVSA